MVVMVMVMVVVMVVVVVMAVGMMLMEAEAEAKVPSYLVFARAPEDRDVQDAAVVGAGPTKGQDFGAVRRICAVEVIGRRGLGARELKGGVEGQKGEGGGGRCRWTKR